MGIAQSSDHDGVRLRGALASHDLQFHTATTAGKRSVDFQQVWVQSAFRKARRAGNSTRVEVDCDPTVSEAAANEQRCSAVDTILSYLSCQLVHCLRSLGDLERIISAENGVTVCLLGQMIGDERRNGGLEGRRR